MRAQVTRMRDSAAEHARSAAAAAVAAEVERAKSISAAPARKPVREAGADMFVAQPPRRQTPRWVRPTLAIAASLLVLAAGGYTLGIVPAPGSSSSVPTWLHDLMVGGTQPVPEATAPIVAETPKKTAGPRRARTGDLSITSVPPGARVILDGRERGLAPLDLTDLSAGTHILELRGEAGTVKRSVTVRPGRKRLPRGRSRQAMSRSSRAYHSTSCPAVAKSERARTTRS